MLERIDRYELKERIGAGGQATVYLGEDTLLKRTVAVKVLNQLASVEEAYVDAIMHEARLAAGLDHPNIGLSLDEVVRLTTETTARIMGMAGTLGTLKVGAEGDAATVQLLNGSFTMVDRLGDRVVFHGLKWETTVTVNATQKLNHVATVRDGKMCRP
jgi:serine/threonine protein kinase